MPSRPDPVLVRAAALAPVWWAALAHACVLGALAVGAPEWTGDARAALLPGVPALLQAACVAIGRGARARRVAMALATTTAGFLAIATAGSLGALGQSGSQGGGGVAALFQVACLASSVAVLAVAFPCWRRVEERGAAADAHLAMYEEL